MRAILDSSILIRLFDRGDVELLERLEAQYERMRIPWIALYEYLYGHAALGRGVEERKRAVEMLGDVVWIDQEVLLRALSLDLGLRRSGSTIPFSDVLIAATALHLGCEVVTLDERHFKRIEGLRVVVPRRL